MDDEISLSSIKLHLFLQFHEYGVDSLALNRHEELHSIHRRSIVQSLCTDIYFTQIISLNVVN